MHVVVPEELVEDVDALVGPGRRSRFVVDAIAEKVARVKLMRAAEAAIGSLEHADIQEWATAESTAAWLRNLRSADNERQAMLDRLRQESVSP
jgi:hypothetical protein